MKQLTPEQIEVELEKLPDEWSVLGGATLNRVTNFKDFKSALEYVNKVGAIAEELNHHPDIRLEWGKVEISITTHAAGGLTENDFKLASKIG